VPKISHAYFASLYPKAMDKKSVLRDSTVDTDLEIISVNVLNICTFHMLVSEYLNEEK
jgi:hypothetical protein